MMKTMQPLNWLMAPGLASTWLLCETLVPATGTIHAQLIPDNTLGTESSLVVPGSVQGTIVNLIEGGATRGSALFHSFSDFNVNGGQQVYFANPVGIDNILSRVTGLNASQIDGLLGVTGSANLFLINPNGIVFGPDAQLDVDGAFLASTSDRFRFADGSEFRATDPNPAPLVTVNIPLGLQLGPNAPAALTSEADLTVGGDLTLSASAVTSTGLLSAPNGTVRVEGLNGDVQVQDVEARSAVLSASETLILEDSQLVTQGDLSLLAEETVRIRDSVETPFLAAAGGDLRVQGNNSIDILALNHLDITPFQAGGNLTLVSDGPISGDAHFTSWGNFSIEDLSGHPGSFVSYYDPIISANGNVALGSYTGVALKVEATGSIFVNGNVTITGPDVTFTPDGTGSDIDLLARFPALILRAGLATLDNPPPPPSNLACLGTGCIPPGVSQPGPGTPPPGGIQIENAFIDTSASGNTSAGPVILSASGRIRLLDSSINTTVSGGTGNGRAGDVTITSTSSSLSSTAPAIELINSSIDPASFVDNGRTGDVTIRADNGRVVLDSNYGSTIFTDTYASAAGAAGSQTGGNLTIVGTDVEISNYTLNGIVRPNVQGDGGNITIRALNQGSVELRDTTVTTEVQDGASGNAGNIIIEALDQAAINLSNTTITARVRDGASGNAGNISIGYIDGAGQIIITGSDITASVEDGALGNAGNIFIGSSGNTDQVTIDSSEITTRVDASGVQAGSIFIRTQNLNTQNSTTIDSFNVDATSGSNVNIGGIRTATIVDTTITAGTSSGEAGRFAINGGSQNPADTVTLINSSIQLSAADVGGVPGSFVIRSEELVIRGSDIVSSNTNSSESSNIIFREVDNLEITNTLIEATTQFGRAGFIGVNDRPQDTAANIITLSNSSIEAEALDSGGRAGNVIIQTQALNVNDSTVLARNINDPNGGSIDIQGLSTLNAINSTFEVSTQAGIAGDILINAEGVVADSVTLSDSNIQAEAFNAGGQAGNVVIQTQGLNVNDSTVLARNINDPNGGSIDIRGLNTLDATNSTLEVSTRAGVAGNVLINEGGIAADRITLTDSFIEAEALNSGGQAGNVIIQTQGLSANGSTIQATNIDALVGGNIDIQGLSTLDATNSTLEVSTQSGVAGNIFVNTEGTAADTITLTDSFIEAEATAPGGAAGDITIQAQILNATDSTIQAINVDDPNGGGIDIQGLRTLDATNSTLEVSTESGVAGDILINETGAEADRITLSNSSIEAEATAPGGVAGDITIRTQVLEATDSTIQAINIDDPNGGSITIANLHDLDLDNSSISTQTQSGLAGNINLSNSGSTVVDGPAAAVTASADNGTAGSITIVTDDLEVLNGGEISVSSGSDGAAGGLEITANSILLDRGRITAETGAAGTASSAEIVLNVNDTTTLDNLLRLRNESLISATATGGNASGGNIAINTDFIIAEYPTGSDGSDIVANAGEGNGGNITIDALAAFGIQVRPERTPLNDITASSESGVQGIVLLNTLDTDPDSGLAELDFELVDASDQPVNQCAVGSTGERSDITIAGRGGLPPMPTTVLEAINPDDDWVTLDDDVDGIEDDAINDDADDTAEPMSSLLQAAGATATTVDGYRWQSLCHRTYRASQAPL